MPRTTKRSRDKPPSVIKVVSFDDELTTAHNPRKSSRNKRKTQDYRQQQPTLVTDLAAGGLKALARGGIIFLSALMVYNIYPMAWDLAAAGVSKGRSMAKVHIPSGLDGEQRRELTLNLGNGECLWQPPIHDIPATIDFHKTLVAGYPSGDKRMIFQQMEALTGWAAKDEWDFEYLGDSNHPFIKANYPHHEGIWGWSTNADQVVMVIRNIRKSMVEYHDILSDIGYAKTWDVATENMMKLYSVRPPLDAFLEWRDMRVLDEANWYGWFIDYWMEEGLMRDYFTHKITTPKHWRMLMMPTVYTYGELDYNVVVGADTVVEPSYDPHCANGEISGGCRPVLVVSAEVLRDYTLGPSETAKIANLISNNAKMAPYMIDPEAWECVWSELIVKGMGLKTVDDRPHTEEEYFFSAEMLEKMIWNLNRTITKYGSDDWNHLETSNRIVELLTDHKALIQVELEDVNAGRRKLTEKSFLGPKERERRRLEAVQRGEEVESEEQRKKHFEYFDAMEREHRLMKERRVKEAREKRQAERKEQRMKERKEARQSLRNPAASSVTENK